MKFLRQLNCRNLLAALVIAGMVLPHTLGNVPQGKVLGAYADNLDYPTLQSTTGVSDPVLAFGLAAPTDYGTGLQFIDVFKTARAWIGHEPFQWGGQDEADLEAAGVLDENGWPTSVPETLDRIGTIFTWGDRTDYAASASRAGRYVLEYLGEGDLRLTGDVTIISEVPGRIVADLDGETFNIDIYETDPNSTGDYIRDITLVREEHVTLHEAGALFNPAWIDVVKDARQVRFMDWQITNNSVVSKWDEYPLSKEKYTWTEMVPVEVMVELANEIQADPWFNMPFLADDTFVSEFATYVRDNLDDSLVAYVEHSNEVWNWSFLQATQARDLAESEFGRSDGAAWVNYYGKRAKEVMDIWSSVYGSERAGRLVRVAGIQQGYDGLIDEILDAPMWQTADPDNYEAPVNSFDAIAGTTYFGGDAVGQEVVRNQLLRVLEDESIDDDQYHYNLLMGQLEFPGTVSVSNGSTAVSGSSTAFTTSFTVYDWDPGNYVDSIYLDGEYYEIASISDDANLTLRQPFTGSTVTDGTFITNGGSSVGDAGDGLESVSVYAANRNLQYLAYEGGQHVHHSAFVDIPAETLAALQAHLESFVRSTEMRDLYQELWDYWEMYGDGPFMQFTDVEHPHQYGSFALLATLTDSNPRATYLFDQNETVSRWWQNIGGTNYQQGRTVTGDANANTLAGTNRVDHMVAGEGDDTLYPGPGNDKIHGGTGTDIVMLSGVQSEYLVTEENDGHVVTGPDGSDFMYAVEWLYFEDNSDLSLVEQEGSSTSTGSTTARTPSSLNISQIHSGHSLTDAYFDGGATWPGLYTNIINVLDSSNTGTIAKSTIPGSPMSWRWDNATAYPDARLDIDEFELLVITENNLLAPEALYPDGWEAEMRDERRDDFAQWVNHAIANGDGGNGAEVMLYTNWPAFGDYAPSADWRSRMVANEVEWLEVADYGEANASTTTEIFIVPGNELMIQLWDDAEAGLIPDVVDGTAWQSSDRWWSDDVHPQGLGSLALAYLMLGAVHHEDPRELPYTGIGLSITPTTEEVEYIQDLVWEVLNDYERAGFAQVAPEPVENTAPVAVNDTATVTAGQSVEIRVLDNDSDTDGDTIIVSSVSTPANGTSTLSAGVVTYTAAEEFVGEVVMNYTLSDQNGGTDNGVITVTVTAVDSDSDGVPDATDNCVIDANATQTDTDNDGEGDACDATPNGDPEPVENIAPVAVNDTATVTAGLSIEIRLLDNDSDADDDTLAVSSVSTPASGTSTLSGGVLTYTAAEDFEGLVVMEYTLDDGNEGVATGTVTVTVVAIPDPEPVDSDSDGVPDATDNCVNDANATQTDTDNDGEGDVCDATPNGDEETSTTTPETEESSSSGGGSSGGGGGGSRSSRSDDEDSTSEVVATTTESASEDVSDVPPVASNKVRATDNLKVRTAPAGELIQIVPLGTIGSKTDSLPVEDGGYTWINVVFTNGVTGWVAESFTAIVTTKTETPAKNNQVRTTDNLKVRIAANGPQLGVQSIGSVGTQNPGTQITVGGYTWVHVDFLTGVDGYVATEYLAADSVSSGGNNAAVLAKIQDLLALIFQLRMQLYEMQKNEG